MLNLDKGYYTLAVFLDIKKAFDTINHNILLKKLKHAGVGNNCLQLLTNYLHNRKQAVLYNGNYSNIKTLETGVPQGSTLGPLLFLLYINDLTNVLTNTKCLMFADDTVLYHHQPVQGVLYRETQTDLDAVYKWCLINSITLNLSKSQFVQYNYRKTVTDNMHPVMGNTVLEMVNSYKYLGTIIDENLNCEAQYSKLLQTLAAKKITFNKIRYLLDTETCILLFKSTVQPLFDYNDFIYNLLSRDKIQILQSMQNRFLRIVFRNENIG